MNENIFIKLRIPTILGLAVILLGAAAGVYGFVHLESTTTKVSAQETPQNILITNISDKTATISWQTPDTTLGYVTFGKNSDSGQTALDDRDKKNATSRRLHYVSLKDLSPKTQYQFKVISGKFVSDKPLKFTTASEDSSQNGYQPVIGTVISGDTPLKDGVAYLSSTGMTDQSTLLGDSGSFILPINSIWSDDLLKVFQPDLSQTGTIKVVSEDGQLASATFKITKNSSPIGPLKMGSNIDFTNSTPKPSLTPTPSATPASSPSPLPTSGLKYDLNADGKLNASDYSIMLNNLGRNPKDKRTDLNNDGVVDQKDLKIMEDAIEAQ